jgi:hypothetical protein
MKLVSVLIVIRKGALPPRHRWPASIFMQPMQASKESVRRPCFQKGGQASPLPFAIPTNTLTVPISPKNTIFSAVVVPDSECIGLRGAPSAEQYSPRQEWLRHRLPKW